MNTTDTTTMKNAISEAQLKKNYCLIDAAERGDMEAVLALIAEGADPNGSNYWGEPPLLMASMKGHFEIVQALLEAGADPKFRDKWGRTLLHFAAARGHVETVKVLLKAGANPNLIEEFGQSPLHWAAYNGKAEVCIALLDGGAEVRATAKTPDGLEDPIQYAWRNLNISGFALRAIEEWLEQNKPDFCPFWRTR